MNTTSIVYKKELKDIFRDKKTIIAAILIPFLLYPIIFGLMGKGFKDNMEFLDKGLEMALVDNGNSSIGQFIKSQENIVIVESEDILEEVKEGKLMLGLEIPDNFDESIGSENTADIVLTYDNTSQKSNMAMSYISDLINGYSKEIVAMRLKEKNIDTSILTPIETITKSPEKDESGIGKMLLSLLLPMMLVVFAASGPVASATDLGAGEKERGTLEPLLTTQANRMSLLWGKFLAITTMGVITSLAFVGGLGLSMKISPEAFGYGMEGIEGPGAALDPRALIVMAIFTVLLTMVFGAIALAISMYARSFKEAQTYLMPLTFIGMLGFTSYLIEPKTMSSIFLHIPIINVVVVIKELTLGIFNFLHLGIVLLWMLLYIALSISFARYMFGKEEVIFRT